MRGCRLPVACVAPAASRQDRKHLTWRLTPHHDEAELQQQWQYVFAARASDCLQPTMAHCCLHCCLHCCATPVLASTCSTAASMQLELSAAAASNEVLKSAGSAGT